MSPALAGGFLTTVPPGKSPGHLFKNANFRKVTYQKKTPKRDKCHLELDLSRRNANLKFPPQILVKRALAI